MYNKKLRLTTLCLLFAMVFLSNIYAQETATATEQAAPKPDTTGIDTVWVLIAAFFVFFMQAGFGMVEAGFIRAKNTINILTKNFLDYCMACLGFFMFGYAIMFGSGNLFIGYKGWFMAGAESGAGVPIYAFWLFQAAFCDALITQVKYDVVKKLNRKNEAIEPFSKTSRLFSFL